MSLDLRQLRYFVAVAEERHVTRAAERLGIGQPPLSQQIKAMEAQLGCQLFHRRARGVELTEAGHALLAESGPILERLAQAERSAQRAARGEQGAVRIGVAPTAPFHPFVPRLIRAYRERHPAVLVTLEECLSRQAVAGLAEARLDAAFVRAPLAGEAGLTLHPMLDEPMVAALPAAHRLAGAASLSLESLAAETFIAFARVEGPGIFEAMRAACLAAGFSPILGQEAPRITTALALVAAGLGIALVPQSVSSWRMDGVAYAALSPGGPIVPLGLALRRGHASAVLRDFVALARQAARAWDQSSTTT